MEQQMLKRAKNARIGATVMFSLAGGFAAWGLFAACALGLPGGWLTVVSALFIALSGLSLRRTADGYTRTAATYARIEPRYR